MRRFAVLRLVLALVLLSALGVPAQPGDAQSTFASKTLQASVGNPARASSGALTLSSTGVSFDSPDFVFNLSADDIAAVEVSGTREAFLTLVLEQQSKFPHAYPTLVRIRYNSIGQQENLVVLNLQPNEPVDPAVARVKQFQTFIRAHRIEREQAAVGATGTDAAHRSFGKTLHVALRDKDGLLTFFSDHLQYDNPDVSIRFGLADMLHIDAAGARETFMRVEIRQNSPLQKAYHNYETFEYAGAQERFFVPFVLVPSESIAPAFRLAQDYADYIDAVRAGREQASVAGNAAGSGAGMPSQAPGAAASAPPAGKREIARLDAGFLERHNPSNKLVNGFKAIIGVPGTLILFDTGLGYVSLNQPTNLKPSRLPFLEGGYLKFFVPSEAVSGVRDVSVVRNPNGSEMNNSYIAEVDLDRNSSFYLQHRALMAESDADNRLFFVFKGRGRLAEFLRNAPRVAPARDQF